MYSTNIRASSSIHFSDMIFCTCDVNPASSLDVKLMKFVLRCLIKESIHRYMAIFLFQL